MATDLTREELARQCELAIDAVAHMHDENDLPVSTDAIPPEERQALVQVVWDYPALLDVAQEWREKAEAMAEEAEALRAAVEKLDAIVDFRDLAESPQLARLEWDDPQALEDARRACARVADALTAHPPTDAEEETQTNAAG